MPVISTISIKGGSQKTTTTLCLGLTLARRGYKTVLIDMDGSNKSLSRWASNRAELGKPVPENFMVIPYSHMEEQLKTIDLFDYIDALQGQLGPEDFVIIDVEGTKSDFMLEAIVKSNLLLAPFAMSQLDADGAAETYKQVKKQEKIVGRKIDCRLVPTKTAKLLKTMPNEDRMMVSNILYELEALGLKAFDSSIAERSGYRHLFNNKKAYTLDELPEEGLENKRNAILECEYLTEDVLDALLEEDVEIDPNRVTLGSIIRDFRAKNGITGVVE